jgi:hypothetical protein
MIIMQEELLGFREFLNEEDASELLSRLNEAGIFYKLDKTPAILDNTFIGNSSSPAITIQLRAGDFSKANEALAEYYKNQVDFVDKGYYLFSFTDDELKEILSKPDEWGVFNFQLARKILSERGKAIDDGKLGLLQQDRKTKLAQAETADISFYLAGYLFIVYGILSTVYISLNVIPYLFWLPFLSFIIGRYIAVSKKTLPDGERVYVYRKKDRRQGAILMYLGLAIFIYKTAWFSLIYH